jgi:UDP-N-acetylglucosamine:LPS N-acetylglucosamine transferase
MLVASIGGHLAQLREIARHLGNVDSFYVLNSIPPAEVDLGRVDLMTHSERDWRFLVNIAEALCLIRARRPDVIISTGAGHIVAVALVAKLFRVPTLFVETMSRVSSPSLTGRIMYRLADRFYYQWPGLSRFYPGGVLTGPLV